MKNQTKKRTLSLPKKIIFSLIPIVILLLALELVAGIVCRSRFEKYQTDIRNQGDSRWIKDPLLIWANRPGYLEYDNSAQYNEYGMRVRPGEFKMPEKQPGDFWVFLLGGSAMAGVGSNQNGEWLKITGVSTHPIPYSIDGYLEKMLQRAMPDKNVRVFNCASVSYSIIQGRMLYEKLRFLNPDWIISMDGVNEPGLNKIGDITYMKLASYWARNPIYKFPFSQARFLMHNSALFFVIGEWVLFKTGIIRTPRNTKQDKKIMRYWLQKNVGKTEDNTATEMDKRTANEFIRDLWLFHQTLKYDRQKHLLLVQPHLSMRNPDHLKETEKAVYNFFSKGGAHVTPFMSMIHRKASEEFKSVSQVASMDSLHYSKEWIFVDYCHFSQEANKIIAEELKNYILNDGGHKPFQNQNP